MFMNCLWFNEQAWETVFKPFTFKISEVIWIFYELSLKDRVLKIGFFFLLSLYTKVCGHPFKLVDSEKQWLSCEVVGHTSSQNGTTEC